MEDVQLGIGLCVFVCLSASQQNILWAIRHVLNFQKVPLDVHLQLVESTRDEHFKKNHVVNLSVIILYFFKYSNPAVKKQTN